MKVGFISFHSFSNPGGVKNHILGLSEEFSKRGIENKIIAPRRNPEEDYGKKIILLGTSFPFPFGGSEADLCVNFNPIAIKEVLDREKFDVLHFHNLSVPSAWQIMLNSSAKKSLNILTFHSNVAGSELIRTFPEFLYPVKKMVEWKMDGIIGVSPLILKYFKGFKKPTAVIPNGVNVSYFSPERFEDKKLMAGASPNIFTSGRQGKINILFLGRIEDRKGLIYLLQAFKSLCNSYDNLLLTVVGDGPLEEECRIFVKDNSLDNVIFKGRASEEQAPFYYNDCDIYCSPAIYGESFGIVLIEAMAAGKPVVAYGIDGYTSVLGKGSGKKFLAKAKDTADLASKLEMFILDEKLRQKMGRWGMKEVQKYDWPKIADQVLDFYGRCSKFKNI
ncbi:MAG: glycosyltransferase family 4 protein [Candidatus Paceibacterota bacterium]|jgi:phosphatidylinositol alpha-mannosyltransferase